jgi:hypothetical protein
VLPKLAHGSRQEINATPKNFFEMLWGFKKAFDTNANVIIYRVKFGGFIFCIQAVHDPGGAFSFVLGFDGPEKWDHELKKLFVFFVGKQNKVDALVLKSQIAIFIETWTVAFGGQKIGVNFGFGHESLRSCDVMVHYGRLEAFVQLGGFF